jgi:ribosomal protein S18 acetylase RimI-like enzyme
MTPDRSIASATQVCFRAARAADADSIAALHADSWRRNYRGAYSDSFLDGDVQADRRAVWQARLADGGGGRCTIVAESGDTLVGFAHTVFDADPAWGALVDNLHVAHAHARRGIGSRLLALTAAALVEQRPGSRLHLWVLQQNLRAQAFYRACGGQLADQGIAAPPGNDPSRLNGAPVKLRIVWPDPSLLLAERSS